MSGSSGGFSVTITAKDGASKTIDDINKRLDAMAKKMAATSAQGAKVGADTSGLTRLTEGFKTAATSSADLYRSLDKVVPAMSALTSATTLAGMAALTRRFAELGQSTANVAYQLSTPVEKLGAMRGAVRLVGVSTAALESSMAGLQKTMGDAAWQRSGAAVQAFKQINVDPGAPGRMRQISDVLGDVAEAIKGMDAQTQARTLESLGISPEMLPALKNGRQAFLDLQKEAEKTGGVMSKDMVKHAEDMNHAWVNLTETIEGVGNRLVDHYAPKVTEILKRTSTWIQNNQDLADSIAKIGIAVTGLVAIKPALWVLRLLGLANPVTGAIVGTAAGAAAAYETGVKGARAADLGFEPSGTPGSMDESGNVFLWTNPKTGETLTAAEMDKRLEEQKERIDKIERERQGTPGPQSSNAAPGTRQLASNSWWMPQMSGEAGPGGRTYQQWDPSQWYHPAGSGAAGSGSGSGVTGTVTSEGVRGYLQQAMNEQGIMDPEMRAGIAATAYGESGFQPRSEMGYGGSAQKRGAGYIRNIFGARLDDMSDNAVVSLAQNDEAFFNKVYGGAWGKRNLGNTAEGEGYKFRGRGLFQLTGKGNYEKYGKMLGIDLVNNPDLANDPEIAAKIAAVYIKDRYAGGGFEGVKRAVGRSVGGVDMVKNRAFDEYRQSGEFAFHPATDKAVAAKDGGEQNGHVRVDVHLRGAPPGTSAQVDTKGAVRAAPPRIETAMTAGVA
jgi:predicted chitinase